MTTEQDFQNKLTRNPRDWHTRLVFADWLAERNDPRADGYRVMGLLRLCPWKWRKRWHWSETITGRSHGSALKFFWHCRLDYPAEGYRTRRQAEDAAACAFAMMFESQRAEMIREAMGAFHVK